MQRQTGRFRVKTDDGRIVEVVEYTEFISTDNFEGSGEIEGMKSLRTRNGTRINRIGRMTSKS